jgi:hypothetical protein
MLVVNFPQASEGNSHVKSKEQSALPNVSPSSTAYHRPRGRGDRIFGVVLQETVLAPILTFRIIFDPTT